MREKTKRHRDLVLKLMKENKWHYGTIAPVDCMLGGDDPCLLLDFGTIWEKEEGRKLDINKVQRRLYYILSDLLAEGVVTCRSASFAYGRVNVYELSA